MPNRGGKRKGAAPTMASPGKTKSPKNKSKPIKKRKVITMDIEQDIEIDSNNNFESTESTPLDMSTESFTTSSQNVTKKGNERKRTAAFPFSNIEKIAILRWYSQHEELHDNINNYNTCNSPIFVGKASHYQRLIGISLVTCTGLQLFNFLKTSRTFYTNYTRQCNMSGSAASNIEDLSDVKREIITTFKKEGKDIVRKERSISSAPVSILIYLYSG